MRAALLVLAVAAAGCSSSFSKADDSSVRKLLTAQQEAWNRGDLKAFMDGYDHSPDLVFTSSAAVRQGWDETYAKYQARYGEDPGSMGLLMFDVISIQPVGGDGVVVLGRWNLTSTAQAGRGIFSVVLRRTSHGWRIIHDHTSAESQPIVPGSDR